MSIYLLHLSDLHISEGDTTWGSNAAQKIESVLSAKGARDAHLFVCLTGDIVNKGMKTEYEIAKMFLQEIKQKLTPHFKAINFVIVPGNHDCNLGEKDEVRDMIVEKITKEGSEKITERFVSNCVAVQKDFFEFLNEIEQPEMPIIPSIYWTKKYEVDDSIVSFNCFNTAWFSTIDESEERYGKLLMPAIEIKGATSSKLNVSLMHHPYNWLQQGNMQMFRGAVETSSDIILSGHEHYQRIEGKVVDDLCSNLVVTSGEGKQKDHVRYTLVEVNLINDSYSAKSFLDTALESEASKGFVRVNNKLRFKYPFRNDLFALVNELPNNIGHHKKDRLELPDIYVWPRINKISSVEEVQYQSLKSIQYVEEFSSKGVRWIFGPQYSGKTCLAKSLMKKFNESGKFSLMFSAEELLSRHSDKERYTSFIDDKIKIAYSDLTLESSLYDDRILIIDSVGSTDLNHKLIEKILEHSESMFSAVIVMADETYKLTELINLEIKVNDQFEILKFSSREMMSLIEKWLMAGGGSQFDDNHDFYVKYYLQLLRQAIENNLIPASPFFMTIFLNNAMAMGGEGGTISSSVALIDRMIQLNHSALVFPALGQGGVINFLSEIAYKIFQSKDDHFLTSSFPSFVEYYFKEFKIDLRDQEVLKYFEKKKILKVDYDRIKFSDDYVYFYYLGKYIAENSGESIEVENSLNEMIQKCYREDYSNIIVYVSFFSKDASIFKKVSTEAQKLLSSFPCAKLEEDVEELSKKLHAEVKKLTYDNRNDHKEKLAEYSDQQGELVRGGRSDDNSEVNVVTKAYRYIHILGLMAKNRTGNLKGQIKKDAITEVVSLSARLVSFVFSIVNERFDESLKDLSIRIKKDAAKELSEEEIENRLRKFFYQAFQYFALHVVEKISFCSGAKTLKVIFDEIEKENPTNFNKLCNMNVSFDYVNDVERYQLERYAKEAKNNMFVFGVMRIMAYKFILTNKLDYKVKQALCSMFDIEFQRMVLLSEKKKELSS